MRCTNKSRSVVSMSAMKAKMDKHIRFTRHLVTVSNFALFRIFRVFRISRVFVRVVSVCVGLFACFVNFVFFEVPSFSTFCALHASSACVRHAKG